MVASPTIWICMQREIHVANVDRSCTGSTQDITEKIQIEFLLQAN